MVLEPICVKTNPAPLHVNNMVDQQDHAGHAKIKKFLPDFFQVGFVLARHDVLLLVRVRSVANIPYKK